jgi:hypothetical protein
VEEGTQVAEPARGRDVSISLERANVLGAALLPAIVLLTLGPFAAVWGWAALRAGLGTVFSLWLIPALVLVVVVHEGLHLLGFLLLARAPGRALHFGIDRETLSPYAGCREPVSARAYRLAALLPALLMGLLPFALAMAWGTGWLAVWGALMLVFAGGDLAAVWAIRGVPGRARVLDHPSRVGCLVLDG